MTDLVINIKYCRDLLAPFSAAFRSPFLCVHRGGLFTGHPTHATDGCLESQRRATARRMSIRLRKPKEMLQLRVYMALFATFFSANGSINQQRPACFLSPVAALVTQIDGIIICDRTVLPGKMKDGDGPSITRRADE